MAPFLPVTSYCTQDIFLVNTECLCIFFFLAQPGKDRIFFFSFNYCQSTAILLLLIIKMSLLSNSFRMIQSTKHHPDTMVPVLCVLPEHMMKTQNSWEPLLPFLFLIFFFKGVTGRILSPFFHIGSFAFYLLPQHLMIFNITLLLPNLTSWKEDKILSFNYSPSSINPHPASRRGRTV